MIRYACICALVLSAGVGHAQSVKLAAHEITVLLSGNTAVGKWNGVSYRQYFDPDGSTIYAQEKTPSARGEWRVEEEECQSLWGGAAWEGWFVMEYAGGWYWVGKTTPPTPFEVVAGEQLIAE